MTCTAVVCRERHSSGQGSGSSRGQIRPLMERGCHHCCFDSVGIGAGQAENQGLKPDFGAAVGNGRLVFSERDFFAVNFDGKVVLAVLVKHVGFDGREARGAVGNRGTGDSDRQTSGENSVFDCQDGFVNLLSQSDDVSVADAAVHGESAKRHQQHS